MPDSTDAKPAPHRRVSDSRGGPPTVIGPGVSFRGDIIAPGAVMLSGNVQGDGDVGGMLTVARDFAVWQRDREAYEFDMRRWG